jgi:hypothetical protein
MLIVYFRRRYTESKSLVGCARMLWRKESDAAEISKASSLGDQNVVFNLFFAGTLSFVCQVSLCAHRYSSRKTPRSKVKRGGYMEIAFPSAADLKNEELKSPGSFFSGKRPQLCFFSVHWVPFFVVVTLLLYLACGFLYLNAQSGLLKIRYIYNRRRA